MTRLMTHREPARRDEGFITVAALSFLIVIALVSGLVLYLVSVTLLRHQAESAADLAALAGVRHLQEGPQQACSAAREIAHEHAAELEWCAIEPGGKPGVVAVHVRLALSGELRIFGPVVARARAGDR